MNEHELSFVSDLKDLLDKHSLYIDCHTESDQRGDLIGYDISIYNQMLSDTRVKLEDFGAIVEKINELRGVQ